MARAEKTVLTWVPNWFQVFVAIGTGLVTMGIAYATFSARMGQMEKVNADQDGQIKEMRQSLDRIDRNLIRIGGKLGIEGQLERP